MKKIIIFSFCFFSIIWIEAQDTLNLSFEKFDERKSPLNWDLKFLQGGSSGYILNLDSIIKHDGKCSLSITNDKNLSSKTFGACAYTIPAIYEGNTITLKGYMKTESVKKGFAGLWLRIDGEESNLQFNNMQKENIHGTNEWKQYRIDLVLPPEARNIVFGGLLTGEGKMWLDNFQLMVDGKDIQEAKLKKQVEETEDERKFRVVSGIFSADLSDRVNDLAVLGKVWGFLKYYHPVVTSGKYNWDYELFKIMPKILHSKCDSERNAVLCVWIDSLGNIENRLEKIGNDGSVKQQPDYTWINQSMLGDSLMRKLNFIKNVKRYNESYYIGLVPGVGNPKFKNEKSYATLKYPDAGFRLLCLYRYWNMIQYFFPYKNLIGEDWNKVLKEFIPKFINASSELEYKLAVLELISRIHDTHASIWNDKAIENYEGNYFSPLKLSFIEEKAVVVGFYNQELGGSTGLKKGDVIEKINGKSVDEIIREKLPFTSASNYSTQLRIIAATLLRSMDSVIAIDWKRGNSSYTSQIKCFHKGKIDINTGMYGSEMDTCFKILPYDISYIYPGTIKNEFLPSIMPEVLKSKGLIIDLRCYPSDFIVFTLSEYLLPRKANFVEFSTGSITSPGLFTMTKPLEVGEKNKKAFKGKVVIIVNEITISNAEYTTMAFRTVPGSVVIGSTTSGADGNVSEIVLPGGVHTQISGIGIYYPDGTETQRVGIISDIEIKPSIKGIAEGKDELLERAIEIIISASK